MNNLLKLIILIQFVFYIQSIPTSTKAIKYKAALNITVFNNKTEISCTTADGDAGICSELNSCNVTEARRANLVNCGSVLKNTLNQICCPKNASLDTKFDSYKNDLNCGKHAGTFFEIVGGQDAKPHDLPWMVGIYQVVRFPSTTASNFTTQFYRFICGGTLVSRQHVVSAAHCAVSGWRTMSPNDFLIKVGASNIDSTGTLHKVQGVWAHENYRPYQRYNDISLFKLAQPVQNEKALAACLPMNSQGINFNSVLREGTPMTIAGWGTTSFLGKLSENLKTATVHYISNQDCSRNYTKLEGSSVAYPSGIDSSMICAGSRLGGVDSCQGDSGGPLTYEDQRTRQVYLIGVVSFGYRCAYPNYPGIYTNVRTYLNWILTAMRR